MASADRVIELIQQCNRVGRIAFDEERAVRAKFNQEILTRSRRSRKKVEDVVVEPGPVVLPVTA